MTKDEQDMIDLINENLKLLNLRELGKVYKFIRTKLIANIPGNKEKDELDDVIDKIKGKS